MATLCGPIEVADAKGALIVRVASCDLVEESALDDVERALSERAEFPASEVVVDLSTVQFVSSGGLAALLRLRRAVLARGGRVALRGLCERVREVLFVTRLNSLFALRE